MRGHIAKKGNRYYAVIYDGVDPATGKPKRRWHAAGTTRRGAERVLADLVKRKHDGTYVPPERITLADYLLERWLPGKRTRVAPSTAGIYERNIRLYIAPNIGRIQLQELQPEDLDSLYAKLLSEGGSAGSGLSVRSVRLVHATVQSALRDAVRKGTVHRNVADVADPPAIGHDRRLARVWTGEQIRDFLAAIDDHDLYPLFLRPPPHARHHPPPAKRAPQGRQRTPRTLQRRHDHEHLPARHAHHASRGSDDVGAAVFGEQRHGEH